MRHDIGQLARFMRLLALCLALLALPAQGEEAFTAPIEILDGEITLRDNIYYLSAHIDYPLNDAVLEALESGVPLTFELQIELDRPRSWLWNADIASLSQRYRIRYHALSDRYVVTNLNSGETRSFIDQSAALADLGRVEELPLIDAPLLQAGQTYEVWLRAQLDLESLPRPLQTVAYLSPEWRLVSEWKVWRVQL